MPRDLLELKRRVDGAIRPEDLLGAEYFALAPSALLEAVGAKFEELFEQVDRAGSDTNEDRTLAREIVAKLRELHSQAMQMIELGLYGFYGYNKDRTDAYRKSFKVGSNTYFVGPKYFECDEHTLYQGFMQRDGESVGDVMIKVAASHTISSFIQREADILTQLHQLEVPQWKHLPLLIDRFEADSRLGLIFRATGGYTLREIMRRGRWSGGIDRKHMIWILDRILSLLGYVHSCGVIHGNINPDTIVIQPKAHNAILIGWERAQHEWPLPTPMQMAQDADPEFAAPEVKESGVIGAWSDIYALGRTMIWILSGGNSKQVPPMVEEPLRELLYSMTEQRRRNRKNDAWLLYDEQGRIKDQLWERKFLPFVVD